MIDPRWLTATLLSGSLAAAQPAAEPLPDPDADALTVMTFNIWVGGTRGDPDPDRSKAQTLDVMRRVNPDVICMQENAGFAEEYAAALGYNVLVQDRSTAILTRFEIAERSENGWGARLSLPGGEQVWVFNAHFPAAPYQPYQLMGIEYFGGRFISAEPDAITEAVLARGENAIRCLRDMQPALRSGSPVFLSGDFNEPSHLDWTPPAAKARALPASVAWPTTLLFERAGMRDAYRAVHPDPIASPGFTWTPRPDTRDVMDRIDIILFTGAGVEAREARVVGESDRHADIVIAPYPSDHRAVVATFTLPERPASGP